MGYGDSRNRVLCHFVARMVAEDAADLRVGRGVGGQAIGVGPVPPVVGRGLGRVEPGADDQCSPGGGARASLCKGPPTHVLHHSRRDDLHPREGLGRVRRDRRLAGEVLVCLDLVRQRMLIDTA